MTILELCDFGGPYGGSFVPMVGALAKEAARRGYATTAVFPPRAAGRAWVKQLEPDVQRLVIASSRSRRDLARLVERLAADARLLWASGRLRLGESRRGDAFLGRRGSCHRSPGCATDIPGHTAIGKLPNLYFVERDNPQALAESILQLTERSEVVASRLADEARRRIAGRLGLDQWASNVVDLCDNVARRH